MSDNILNLVSCALYLITDLPFGQNIREMFPCHDMSCHKVYIVFIHDDVIEWKHFWICLYTRL